MRSARDRTLYVLEDSDEDFDTLETALRSAGLRPDVRRAVTGDVFLDLLRDRAERGGADRAIVLIDLNTPGLDGRDVLHDLKADERTKPVPVVVLTTSSNPRDVDACYAAGANAYHVKPVDHETHQAVLQEILEYWLRTVVLPGAERTAA